MTGPAVLECAFRVRYYECDAYGHVNHANYLRYMQEAAFDASAAVGYDVARYEQMGKQWLVRETDITYMRPLVYGDTVLVKTYVADFRRVRSRRIYEMRLAGTDEPVATASTEWVFLDTRTQRPTSIPPEMVEAFYKGDAPVAGRSEPFPDAPPPPPGTFRIKQRVQWRDIDQAQHVNNANYLAYIEECNSQVGAAHGWPLERLMAEGLGIVARRYRIEYRQPAVNGDELTVATYVSDAKRATAVRHYTIHRQRDDHPSSDGHQSDGGHHGDADLLARAHVLWVWVDLETGRPRRIPDEFRKAFRDNIAEPA